MNNNVINIKLMKFLQEGGVMTPEQQAPEAGAPQQEQMMAQLQQIAQSIIQEMGPEAAMALAQMIVEMLQGGQQLPAAEQQPAFQRNGGTLKRIR